MSRRWLRDFAALRSGALDCSKWARLVEASERSCSLRGVPGGRPRYALSAHLPAGLAARACSAAWRVPTFSGALRAVARAQVKSPASRSSISDHRTVRTARASEMRRCDESRQRTPEYPRDPHEESVTRRHTKVNYLETDNKNLLRRSRLAPLV
jgi:hypothetical protein